MTASLAMGLAAAVIGSIYAAGCAVWVIQQPTEEDALQGPYQAIRQGAHAFMPTQYGVIAGVGAIIFTILWATPSQCPNCGRG